MQSFNTLDKVLNMSAERYLRTAGDLFVYEGDYESALLMVEKTLAITPDDVRALGLKGDILYCLNRDLEALDLFNQALALKPDSIEALISKACTLDVLGKPKESLDCCMKALLLARGSNHFLLSAIYEQILILLIEFRRYGEANHLLNEANDLLLESDAHYLQGAYGGLIRQRLNERLRRRNMTPRLRILPNLPEN